MGRIDEFEGEILTLRRMLFAYVALLYSSAAGFVLIGFCNIAYFCCKCRCLALQKCCSYGGREYSYWIFYYLKAFN